MLIRVECAEKQKTFKVKFWNWGPITIWHNRTSIQFSSSQTTLHPNAFPPTTFFQLTSSIYFAGPGGSSRVSLQRSRQPHRPEVQPAGASTPGTGYLPAGRRRHFGPTAAAQQGAWRVWLTSQQPYAATG